MPGFLPVDDVNIGTGDLTLNISLPRRKSRTNQNHRRSRFYTHRRAESDSSSNEETDAGRRAHHHHRGRTSSPRRRSLSRSRSRVERGSSSSDSDGSSSSSGNEILTSKNRIFRNFKARKMSWNSSSSSSSSSSSGNDNSESHHHSDYDRGDGDESNSTSSSSSSSSSSSHNSGVLTVKIKLFYGLRGKHNRFASSSSSSSSSSDDTSSNDTAIIENVHVRALTRPPSISRSLASMYFKDNSDSESVSSISSHSSDSSIQLVEALYGYKSEHTYDEPEQMWTGLSENAMHAQWAIDDRNDGMRTLVVASKPEESWSYTCKKMREPFELIRFLQHLTLAVMFISIVFLETAEESEYYRTMRDSLYDRIGGQDSGKERLIIKPEDLLTLANQYVGFSENLENSVELYLDLPNNQVSLEQHYSTTGRVDTVINRMDMGPFTVGLNEPRLLLPWQQDRSLTRIVLSVNIKQFAFNPSRRCDDWHIVSTITTPADKNPGMRLVTSVTHSLCTDPKVSERVHAADTVALIATGVSFLLFLTYLITLMRSISNFFRYMKFSLVACCKRPEMVRLRKTKKTVNKHAFMRDVHWSRTRLSCAETFSIWHVASLVILLLSCTYSLLLVSEYALEYNIVDFTFYAYILAFLTLISILCLMPTLALLPYSYTLLHVTVFSSWKMLCRVLIGFMPVFVGYSLLGWVVLNGLNGQFNNLDLITMHLFAIQNGDGVLDFFNLLFGATRSTTMRLFTRVYVYSYCLFFTLILARQIVSVVGFYVNLHDPKSDKLKEEKHEEPSDYGSALHTQLDLMNETYDVNKAQDSISTPNVNKAQDSVNTPILPLLLEMSRPPTPQSMSRTSKDPTSWASPQQSGPGTPRHAPSSRVNKTADVLVSIPSLTLDDAAVRKVQFSVDAEQSHPAAAAFIPPKRFIWSWPELHGKSQESLTSVLLRLPVFTGSLLSIMSREDTFIRNLFVSLEPKMRDPTFLLRNMDLPHKPASPLPPYSTLEPYLLHFCTCLYLHSVGFLRRILKLEKQFINKHKRPLITTSDNTNEYSRKIEMIYQNSMKAFWGRLEKKMFNRGQSGIQITEKQ